MDGRPRIGKKRGLNELISIEVSSYHLPKKLSLEQAYYAHTKLKVQKRTVRCSVNWIKRNVVSAVWKVIEEQIFGLPVVSGIGLDHTDDDVGRRDTSVLSFFHGKHRCVTGFVSPPVSHKIVDLPLNDFGKAMSTVLAPRGMIGHKSKSKHFARNVRAMKIKKTHRLYRNLVIK
jgi:hypothetical protein